jgi:hypothetical protein
MKRLEIADCGLRIAEWRSQAAGQRPARSFPLSIRNPKSEIRIRVHPRASVLLLVLVVIAMLALGANTYLQLMQTEHRAVRRHGRQLQSLRLAESGVEYLKTFVVKTPAQLVTLGGLVNNASYLKAQLADDQPRDVDRGRFTLLAPAQLNGIYSGVRYGVENESAKLNLHTLLAEGLESEARNRLMMLPNMTIEVADAILDWIDPDATPREYGAEIAFYSGLSPAYEPRNGPLSGLDELLLVRGVTPELLYGVDQNRNMIVDANETLRGALLEVDNTDGAMNRGWSAYLTIASVELMGGAAAAAMIDLNNQDLQALYTALAAQLTDEQAKFIILYRQYGQPSGGGQGQEGPGRSGDSPGGSAPGGQQIPGGGQTPGGQTAGGRPDPSRNGNAVSASSIQLNLQQQGGTQINSILDLINATAQVPSTPPGGQNQGGGQGGQQGGNNGGNNGGGNNNQGSGQDGQSGNNNGGGQNGQNGGGKGGPGGPGGGNNENQPPPQTVLSPWQDNPNGYRDLLKLMDAATCHARARVAGRVNVTHASRPVLLTIPTLTPALVDQIIAAREPDPSPTLSEQRHALWLLIEGFVQLDQMRQIERFITSGGDAFSGQSIGFFDGDPMPVRAEFILDRSVGSPRLRQWRDLTPLGPGFAPDLLGAVADDTQ